MRVVGRDDDEVGRLQRPLAMLISVRSPSSRSISSRTKAASSGDCVRLPSCSTSTKRSPAPSATDRSQQISDGSSRPS